MNTKMKNWYIAGAIFTMLFGTLLHFAYDWSGQSPLVGIFGAVNESIWEHLKLLFWPTLIFSIAEYNLFGREQKNFFVAKAASLYIGVLLIVILFYTYSGILGTNYLAIDILIFLLSVMVSWFVGYRIITSNHQVSRKANILSFFAILLLVLAFVVFTFTPPQLPLFEDPITGTCGI